MDSIMQTVSEYMAIILPALTYIISGIVAIVKLSSIAKSNKSDIESTNSTINTQNAKIDHVLLEDVLDAIRPSFQADGGDIELIGVDDETGVVTIEMTGACAACMFASSDISEGIDTIIKEHVPGVTAVRPVMY